METYKTNSIPILQPSLRRVSPPLFATRLVADKKTWQQAIDLYERGWLLKPQDAFMNPFSGVSNYLQDMVVAPDFSPAKEIRKFTVFGVSRSFAEFYSLAYRLNLNPENQKDAVQKSIALCRAVIGEVTTHYDMLEEKFDSVMIELGHDRPKGAKV